MKTTLTKKQLIELLNDLEYENRIFYYHKYDLNHNISLKRKCKNHIIMLNKINNINKIDLYHSDKNNTIYAFIYFNFKANDIGTGQLIRFSIYPKTDKKLP